MGTDIEDFHQRNEKQVEIELDKVMIDQEKTKEQIGRQDSNLLVVNVWKISSGGIYPTHITISRSPLWVLCRWVPFF